MKQGVPLLIILILFCAFIVAKTQLYEPVGTPLEVWEHSDGTQRTPITLPAYSTIAKSGLHSFVYKIETLKEKHLVIPQLYGYAYKLYFNDVYIAEIGDLNNPTANIWTYAQHFDFSAQPILATNTIRLDVYGLHDIGFSAIPFLTDETTALKRITVLNLLNHDLILLIMGFAMAFAFLLFFLAFKIGKNKSVHVNYGIALSLFAFYSLEFTYRGTSGTIQEYLWLRKSLLMSIYVAGYFLLIAQRAYFLDRKTRPLFALFYMAPLLFMISAQDFIAIHQIQTVLNIISLTTIIYIASIGFVKRYHTTLIPNAILALTVVHTILNLFFQLMQPYMFHLGFMVFSFGLCTIIVMDFQVIESENKKLGEISKTDPLTKAYNRSILTSLTCTVEDCFVFIDLDRFKAYNDTFGHQQGDQLLKDIVAIFNLHIRKSDCVIRYGGDEFIIYFNACPEQIVRATIQYLQTSIQALGNIDISYGICPYKDSVVTTVLEADRLMYAMKNQGKNQAI